MFSEPLTPDHRPRHLDGVHSLAFAELMESYRRGR